MKALVLGATGLVGAEVLARLLAEPAYTEVRVLLRRAPGAGFGASAIATASPAKLQIQLVDFEALDRAPASTWAVDHIYCCLGTTIKQAGSQAAFRRVDHDYPEATARLGAQAGVSKYLLVSSVGADAGARNFYLRVKGETELAIQRAGIGEVHVFRPSLLLGHRSGSRPLERVSIAVSRGLAPLLAGPLAIYRPIEASQLARAMLAQGLAPRRDGIHVHQGDDLKTAAPQTNR